MDYLPLIDRSKVHYKRSDVSPIFGEPAAFARLVEDLVAPFPACEVDRVAGLDAMGFIVGTALALRLNRGFIPIRKGGKLPVLHDSETFRDYTGAAKALSLRVNPFPKGSRILLVDEWIETGSQIRASIALVERAGGIVAGIVAVAFRRNEKTADLWGRYRCHSVWPEAT